MKDCMIVCYSLLDLCGGFWLRAVYEVDACRDGQGDAHDSGHDFYGTRKVRIGSA